MAVVALIKFAQGGPFGPSGQVFLGATGSLVTVENDDNTDVASWFVELLYVPPGSALGLGVLASGDSATPLATFTPDVTGPYRIRLSVYDAIGQTGDVDVDIRNFVILESKHGFALPPYQKDPDPLPTLASAEPGAKPNEMNIGGFELGWAGTGSDGMLQDFLKQVDASNFDLLPDLPGVRGAVTAVEIDAPVEAIGLTYDGTDLWLTDKQSSFVFRLDASSGTPKIVAKIDLSSVGVTEGRKVTTDGTHVFAAHLTDNLFTIIEKATNSVVGVIDVNGAGTRRARDVVVSGDDVYVVVKRISGGTGEIHKYSKTSALSSFPTPLTTPVATLVNPTATEQFEELAIGAGKLWATGEFSDKLHRVNLATLAHEGSQSIAPRDTIGVLFAFGSVWVSTGGWITVDRFDPNTFPSPPVASIATSGFGNKGLATDGTYIYTSDNFGAELVDRIDPTSNTVVGTASLASSSTPADMAADSTYLWVADQIPGGPGLRRVTLSSFTETSSWSGSTFLDYLALAGDVTGDFDALTVTKIQGRDVNIIFPLIGHAYRWNGAAWDPGHFRQEVPLLAGIASTDLTGYVAIGAIRFDPSAYLSLPAFTTVTFEVVIETTNVANSADIRLFNVTDLVAVTTLTSSSLTPDYQSAVLTVSTSLPLSPKIYELQLKMGAGGSPDFVTCKMGRFVFNG